MDAGASLGSSTAQDKGCPSGLAPASGWDDAVDPSPFVRQGKDGLLRLELLVRGAKCGGCIKKIETGLSTLPGMREARLNLSTGKLSVAWEPGSFAPIEITRKLTALGYQAAPFDPETAESEDKKEARSLLLALAISGFAMMNIMLMSVSVWAGHEGEMGQGTRDFMHLISGLIAIPAALFAGRPFFRSAWRALKVGRANMDVPISLAVFLALGISISETIMSGKHAYFDAAVMLLFFLLIGRYLDHMLRIRARAAARELLALQAVTVSRLEADGTVMAISAKEVVPGDRLILAPGDRAPVDGTIEDGNSTVDSSLVTGESEPQPVIPGQKIRAGIVNLDQRLLLRASARIEDSLLAELARLIEAGEQSRSKYIRLADKAAKLYVPFVHTLALATFLGWFFLGDAGLRASILYAVAVLIITCPCALGLAAPAVQVVATGRLFKQGIFVKSGDALERLAEVTHVVLDKTGTLTLGKPLLVNKEEIAPDVLQAAALLARASRHPFSRAIVAEAGPGPLAEDIDEHAGLGVRALIDGQEARLGRATWVFGEDSPEATQGAASKASEMWFRLGSGPAVRFLFKDQPRDDAAETVAALKARGLGVEMLSGDKRAPAAEAAALLGVTEWRAELSPQEKTERLEELAQAGHKVAMVGDGLNDTPALALAHASLSPGTAADASQAAADFVFQGEDLKAIVTALDVAKKSKRRVLENFGLSAVYNMLAVPLAVLGFVTPLVAALAMSGSSIVVTLNALRLRTK